jgi:acetylornithine deacetylase
MPSFSREEEETAARLGSFLEQKRIPFRRKNNNVWATNKYYSSEKSTVLLNSHHDTVKPSDSYTVDPFDPRMEDGKLFGLGSNDAGGALVSLLGLFLTYYLEKNLPFNLVYAATAEEEVSGKGGVESILEELGTIDLAIVGEPTGMQMSIAEKGLLVLDCHYYGIAGHAARNEGENAIYKCTKDLEWFKTYQFENVSSLLGPVQMNVTKIEAGKNHNVVPDKCSLVVDVRCTDAYTLEETLEIIDKHTEGEIVPRSVRLRPSVLAAEHPIMLTAYNLGISTYGSPTLSDQALMPFASLKMGPGESSRSHMADEYIFLHEIEKGIEVYTELLEEMKLSKAITISNETLE